MQIRLIEGEAGRFAYHWRKPKPMISGEPSSVRGVASLR
jgi:hypothetical protein